jgi:thiamine pyrophosphokinase
MPNNAAIVANGSIHNYEEIRERLITFDWIIAADGGLQNCSKMNIVPNLILGDMDSVSNELLNCYPKVKQKIFSVEKDKTDVELAVEEALALNVQKIIIFGALEKRIDHSIYNLYLLSRYPGTVWIESEYETSFIIENNIEIDCFQGQVVSLLPLGMPAEGITTHGLKWELKNASFDKNLMSISNVCLKDFFRVEVKTGNLLCCLCK